MATARRLKLVAWGLLALLGWTTAAVSRPTSSPAGSAAPTRSAVASSSGGLAPTLGSAFTSAESCAALVAAQQRLERRSGVARFASWNLRWFPDGKPGAGGAGADLAWLACTLWWLDADVVAVQEVKQTPSAQAALSQLLRELNRLSQGRYVSRTDDCGRRVPQHVGLIWNERRVKATGVRTLAELNPSGEACGKQLRPGLAARLSFPGGLDLTAVSAHFKSKADERALDLRESTFGALPGVLRQQALQSGDSDLLVLGDLNTMGCEECSPPVSAREELHAADQALRRGGLRVVAADAAGSHFHDGRPSLLDHAVASSAMRELEPSTRTHVAGACGATAGAEGAPHSRAAKRLRQRLSDHCPIVLDLSDRDLD